MTRSANATRICIAVVGPGDEAPAEAMREAENVGRLIARNGWVTLCGGRAAGVMAAAARGASAEGGIVIGLLPGTDRSDAAPALTVALTTGLGEARNAVLVGSADAVIACGINAGTASEIALALKARTPVALVRPTPETAAFFAGMSSDGVVHAAADAEGAVGWITTAIGLKSQ